MKYITEMSTLCVYSVVCCSQLGDLSCSCQFIVDAIVTGVVFRRYKKIWTVTVDIVCLLKYSSQQEKKRAWRWLLPSTVNCCRQLLIVAITWVYCCSQLLIVVVSWAISQLIACPAVEGRLFAFPLAPADANLISVCVFKAQGSSAWCMVNDCSIPLQSAILIPYL